MSELSPQICSLCSCYDAWYLEVRIDIDLAKANECHSHMFVVPNSTSHNTPFSIKRPTDNVLLINYIKYFPKQCFDG